MSKDHFDGPCVPQKLNKYRSCTDIIFLIIFLAAMGAWMGIAVFGFVQGDLHKLENITKQLPNHLKSKGFSVNSKGLQININGDEFYDFARRAASDIKQVWVELVVCCIASAFICLIYILIMRWIAGIMTWLSIAAGVALLAAGTGLSFQKYTKVTEDKTFWLVLSIFLAIFLGIVVLVLIFLRKRIILAIGLIKEGSKAISHVMSVLIFPLFSWSLQILVIGFGILIGLLLESAKCKEAGCSEHDREYNSIAIYIQLGNLFGLLWAAFFVSALAQMILAYVFAECYWNRKNIPVFLVTKAVGIVTRYHMGTAAFGSLLVTICRFIRIALEYIDAKLKASPNPFTKALLCCLKCFFWCLENFIKFINKNAYIMCAINGSNFCKSAKDAFNLLVRNCIRVYALDKVTSFLFFLSKLIVTAGVTATAYFYFDDRMRKGAIEVSGVEIVLVLVAIVTYLIASIFFLVYSTAVDTVFLCCMEDLETNDGSLEKPYCMSKNLMRILDKRNKKE